MVSQIEKRGCDKPANDYEKRSWHFRGESPKSKQRCQGYRSNQQCGAVNGVQAFDPMPELLPGIVAAAFAASDLGQLACCDVHGRSEEKSSDHGFGDELRNPSHFQKGHENKYQSSAEGNRRHK